MITYLNKPSFVNGKNEDKSNDGAVWMLLTVIEQLLNC